MSENDCEGQQFKTNIGVGFLIEFPLKSTPNDKDVILIQKRAIYLLMSTHKS